MLLHEESSKPEIEVKMLPVLTKRGVKPWYGRLKETALHVGGRVVVATGIGAVLLLLPHLVSVPESVAKTLDHVGNAFLVSAIVIFAFEWGAEVKRALTLSGSLAYTLQEHADKILDGSAESKIAEAMRQLARSPDERYTEQWKEFAQALRELASGDWAAKGYLEFLRWYHDRVSQYAHDLATFSTNVREDPDARTEFKLTLPDPGKVADMMLTSTNRAMESEDGKYDGRYYAISDAYIWTQFTAFGEAQREAVDKGLEAKRIFVLGKPSERISRGDGIKIMFDHLDRATKSKGRYEIKLIEKEDFDLNAAANLRTVQYLMGVFAPRRPKKLRDTRDRRLPVIFEVLTPDLSTFRISGADEALAVIDNFDTLWDLIPPFGDPQSNHESIRDHLLAYRMQGLEGGGSYRGFSNISDWRGEKMERMREATFDVVDGKKVVVQRLFVFDGPDASPETLKIVKRHTVTGKIGRYQWGVCLRKNLPPELTDDIPFALVIDGTRESDKLEIIREHPRDDKPFVTMTAETLVPHLIKGWNVVWTDFENNRADRIREVFGEKADEILDLLPNG